MKDYYKLLEVNKNASEDTIKKVFRMLIKKNHPDLFSGNEKARAEKRVKELNEAYAVLIDKEKREKYNRELEEKEYDINATIATLTEENEYLKTVIQQKDKMIKEYLEEIGVDTSNIVTEEKTVRFSKKQEVSDYTRANKEAYDLYQSKQIVKNIIYMLIISFAGIIVLGLSTGVSIFKIVIDIFKNMF